MSLTQRLIERPSVTPDDAGCQALLTDELKSLGFVVEELPFGEVSNFWATHGSGSPYLVFAGHTDVVPTGPPEQWTSDPFRPEIRDGLLYGRGSADMKGSLAAMLIASRAFVEANPDHAGTLAWLVTSDEEGDAVDGTVRVVAHLADQGIRPDYCVVGEPSSSAEVGDVIRIGRRGSLNGKLAVHGVQGHVAYPDQASNPIHAFSRCLAALVATEWDQGNAAFPPTSFQVSNLHAGTGATNVVPGELEVLFNFRYSTEQTAAGLKQRVAAVLDEHGVPHSLSWSLSGEPFLTADGPLIQAVRESICAVQGFEPEASTGGGTSDGRFIAPAGTEVVELGPVNATIHSIDECTPVADLARLAEMYRGIADRLLGVPLSGGV